MQIIAPRHTVDVIVVGSGWAAKRLAEAGVKVAPFELKHRDTAHELARRTSGVLGYNLMDHHASADASGALPPPVSTPQSVGAAQRPNGVYMMRFKNTLNGPQQRDLIRGYGSRAGAVRA